MLAHTYSLSPRIFVLRDSPERIDFHIKSGDYFAFLATAVGFLEEAITKCSSTELTERERTFAKELRNDLRYVHANYTIEPATEVKTIQPKGNLFTRTGH